MCLLDIVNSLYGVLYILSYGSRKSFTTNVFLVYILCVFQLFQCSFVSNIYKGVYVVY